MDLVDTGTDPWIIEYDACEKVGREIMETLNLRNNEKASSQSYYSLSAKIRIRLKQYGIEVNELKRKLNSPKIISSLTPEEKGRRQRQVEGLLSREVQLLKLFNEEKKSEPGNSEYNKSRAELMRKKGDNSVLRDMGTTSWGEIGGESNEVSNSSTIEDMKKEQERLFQEQDKGLETLLQIVSAQSKIATSINNEVEHHNEILVDIADGMERVDGRITQANELVKVITKKESIWGYWLVALLLFIAILGIVIA